jgi:predicted ATPase/DNA-binding CsgD family transcriptional regulator
VLPAQLTTFVGRASEVAQVTDLLGRHRLVAVTGPGGCGKTRLALQVLGRLGDDGATDVRWVDLGPVTDPGRVAEVVAAAAGVLVDPAAGALAALTGQLRDRRVALALDNCEHLLDACADLVDAVLRTCPGVTVLATSRQPLGVPGESVWRVPPMDEGESVALFAERARLVRPPDDPGPGPRPGDSGPGPDGSDPAVHTVCRRLDGIPLAIELAAAWTRMLTPAQIAAALDDRFRLLVGGPRGVAERQQTLAASMDWSHDLLSDRARTLLRRLSVFASGFTLAAAESVCAGPDLPEDDVLTVLGTLVDSSMVAVSDDGSAARYRLLDTIRAYAAERLDEAGETGATRDRHLAHALGLAERAAARLDREDQDPILAALEREHDDLRAAVAWGLSRPDPQPGRRLAAAMSRFWLLHGHAHEGIPVLQRAIAAAPEERSGLQADLLSALALVGMPAGRFDVGDAADRALVIAEEVGDHGVLARACAAGLYVPFLVDFQRAEELALRAQRHAVAAGDTFAEEYALLMEAASYMCRDRHDDAVRVAGAAHERSVTRNDRFCASFTLGPVMHAAVMTGDVRRAVAVSTTALRIAEPLGDYFVVGTNTINLAWATGLTGDVAGGRRLVESIARSVDDAGPDVDVLGMSVVRGKLQLWDGDTAGAVDLLERALRWAAPLTENWMTVRALPALSDALRRLGRLDEAAERAEQGIGAARRIGVRHVDAESLEALARALDAAGEDPARAADLHRKALAIRVELGLWTFVADSLDALAAHAARADRPADALRLLAASSAGRERSGYPRLAIDRAAHEDLVAELRDALGDDAFAAAEADGAALSLDDAAALAGRRPGPGRRPPTGWASLTPAEEQVAALVVQGLTNPQIAERLYVSRATVKTHLSHIYAKLGVANRTELAASARAQD